MIKIPEAYRGPLVKEITAGTIQRARYPELWPPERRIHITMNGPVETMTPPDPSDIPQADRRRLARQIMKGEVTAEEFPCLWPPQVNGGIRVNLPAPPAEI